MSLKSEQSMFLCEADPRYKLAKLTHSNLCIKRWKITVYQVPTVCQEIQQLFSDLLMSL